MIRVDDRTPEQAKTHTLLVAATDAFLSGWGGAEGGTSVAAWACTDATVGDAERTVRNRGDMKRVRVVIDRPGERYRPKNAAHLHIYVYKPSWESVACNAPCRLARGHDGDHEVRKDA